MECSTRPHLGVPATIIWTIPKLLYTTLIFCLMPSITRAQEISYIITEEEPVGFRVGNLVTDLNLEVDSDTSFQFLSTQLPNETYFTLDESTGELITSQRIDREDPFLCPPNHDVCTYDMEILVLPVTSYRFINVHVTIRDKNDHTPMFPDEIMQIEVPESVAIGTRIPMENADDPDVGNNTVQEYFLSQDYDGTFGLFITKYSDGSYSIQLEIKSMLDREVKSNYELILLAVDGGTPQARTGSTILNVTVLDSNDHHPAFKRSEYTVNIAENLEVGTEILKVEAVDPDLGTNGQIIYAFSGNVPLFQIESATGVIRTKGRVDYETDESFQLIVKCTNNVPNPIPDFATVTINIIDVNDNRPVLSATAIEGGGNQIHLPETAPPGTLIAFVRVSDPDSGSSGQVRLLLSGHYDDFELQTVNANQYFLASKRALDREDVALYNITIIAEDRGDPILWRQRKFAVWIDDVNDNAPFFSAPIYYVTITENNAPNTPLTTVIATDDDEGENAIVVYSLPGNQHGFSIGRFTGELIAKSVLDREVASSIAVTVTACDTGTPQPLCENVTVMIDVLDENDNPPEFTMGTYELGVYENQDPGTLVGQVRATDTDIGDNAHISYAIKTEGAMQFFRIDRTTGDIYTKVDLDREVQASYAMVVTAKDSGLVSAQKTSSVTVLVSVLDRNDNAPRITYPNTQDDAVFIPLHAKPGLLVAQIEANDIDDGPNARLSYGIIDGDIFGLFGVQSNGRLVTARFLKRQWEGVHFINLRVSDSGATTIESSTQLIVVITDMNFNESLPQDTFFQLYNLTVNSFLRREADQGETKGVSDNWPVVAVIALGSVAFVLLMIFLVVATKCRDKSKSRENQYAAPPVNTTDDMRTGSKPPSERKTSGTNSTNISIATSQSSIPSKNIQKWKNAEKNGSIDSRLGNKQMTTFGSTSDVQSDSMQSLHSNSRRTPVPDPDAEVQKLLNKLRNPDGCDAPDDFSHSSCDSGHGDSDRDTRDSNGTNSMSPDVNELPNNRTQSLPRLQPLAQISGRSLMHPGERGSYAASSLCTPECRTLGHSDLCWSNNTLNGRPKSETYSSSGSNTMPAAGRRHADNREPVYDQRAPRSNRDSPVRDPSRDDDYQESPSHLAVPTARMGAHTAVTSPNPNQNNPRSSPSKQQDPDPNRQQHSRGGSTPVQQPPLTPISEHPEDSPFDHKGVRKGGDKSRSQSRGKSRIEPRDQIRRQHEQQIDNNNRHRTSPGVSSFKDERTSNSPNGNSSFSHRPNHRHPPAPMTNNMKNNLPAGMFIDANGYGSHSSVSSESSSEVNSGGYSLDDLDGVLERCEMVANDAQMAVDKVDQVPYTDWV